MPEADPVTVIGSCISLGRKHKFTEKKTLGNLVNYSEQICVFWVEAEVPIDLCYLTPSHHDLSIETMFCERI